MTRNPKNHSEPVKFITDHNLGKLAKWLRLLGYDTICHGGKADRSFWRRARGDRRVLLTRRKNLQYYPGEVETVVLEEETLDGQLSELLDKFPVGPEREHFFRYCSVCNVRLRRIVKNDVLDRVPPYVLETQDHFYLCPSCSRIYWPGSHVDRIKENLRKHNLMDLP
jgi:hypothetical protein